MTTSADTRSAKGLLSAAESQAVAQLAAGAAHAEVQVAGVAPQDIALLLASAAVRLRARDDAELIARWQRLEDFSTLAALDDPGP